MKRKKLSLAGREPVLTATAQGTNAIGSVSVASDQDTILDNLIKFVGEFGFKQIVFPPLEERRIFAEVPALQKFYGPNLFGITGHEQDVVFSPTNFLTALKLYLRSSPEQLMNPAVAKWLYVLPVAGGKHDRATAHHELGVFVFGDDSSLATAQLINTIDQVFRRLGLPDVLVEITAKGCQLCQKEYQNVLTDHLGSMRINLCEECDLNLKSDIVSVIDCDKNSCQAILAESPQLMDFLDESCRADLMGVLEIIDDLAIPYTLNSGFTNPLVRENVLFQTRLAGGESGTALGHGGNYSSWSQYLGSGVPAVGFLASFENLAKFVPAEKRRMAPKVEVFLIPLGIRAARRALVLHRDLKAAGVKLAEAMVGAPSLKQQLKEAENYHPEIALIIGQKEAVDGTVILRDIRSGMQEVFAIERIVEEVKKRLGE